jgi:hypothetical protein
MWSCAISIVVYLRNRIFSRVGGLSGGVPITLLTPDVSNFRVFCCTFLAKTHTKLRRKQGDKAFRGVMVGYPPDALGYRVYNPATRRITTSVHVVSKRIEAPNFKASTPIDSMIPVA